MDKRKGRVLLDVPFEQNEAVKQLGAKFDRKAKCWYVPKAVDPALFANWKLEANKLSPEEEFGDFIKSRGLVLEGAPVMDGKWHRLPLEGQIGKQSHAGSYKGYLDGKPNGLVQNFRDGDGKPERWVAAGRIIFNEERSELIKQWTKKKELDAQQRREKQAQARAVAATLWRSATRIATKHNCPYLQVKGVDGYDVRVLQDGTMVVPVRSSDRTLHGLQFVNQDGKKFQKDSVKEGCMHIIDPDGAIGNGPLIIAEGYATAASIHEATKRPVVVAFDAGNLKYAALAIANRHPFCDIVIAADDDHASKGPNTGLAKGKEAARFVGGIFAPVKLDDRQKERGATDYNDLHQMDQVPGGGLSVVKARIEAGVADAAAKTKQAKRSCQKIIDEESGRPLLVLGGCRASGLEYWRDCRLDWLKLKTDSLHDGAWDMVEIEAEAAEEEALRQDERDHGRLKDSKSASRSINGAGEISL